MEYEKALEDIGLSQGEIKVYIALLKLGSAPVNKIKQETKIHRTAIYDFLEKLKNKGLVSYVSQNKVNQYTAIHPNKLLDFVKEKEDSIKAAVPGLAKLLKTEEKEINVEVYKGKEGLKASLTEIAKAGKDVVGFGIDETKYKSMFQHLMEQYFKMEEKMGIKERLLASEKAKFVYKKKAAEYRFIPEEFFNPTPTLVYGDKVVITIWDPLTIIVIENRELADGYKKYFELLWKQAKRDQR
ncbi:MAG: helix-turn-helix domain-containing protein [Candidatus Aenigmarchaeota archaeon]|nr:helix-turn-helix domain-containing protein [Candidatus Aenigmarchaeota archaeon]